MNESAPSTQNPSDVQRVIDKIQRLKLAKNLSRAETIGIRGLVDHPRHAGLTLEHGDTAARRKKWAKAIKRFESVVSLDCTPAERDRAVARLAGVYVTLGQVREAELHVRHELDQRPDSLEMRKIAAALKLLHRNGPTNAAVWHELAASPELENADEGNRIEVVSMCVAGLRLAGRVDEADALLQQYYDPQNPVWPERLKDGYCRLIIFDDGRTRVEYYVKLINPLTSQAVKSQALAVTFDTMGQTWDKIPFAYRPLAPTETDFFAVRKQSATEFHQEFTREEFLRLATPIAERYPTVISFGQSLGGYCALYYASWLPRCRVLASAPRNPLNPKYSGKKYARHDLFRHEYDMPINDAVSPTVVYDPKNLEDGPYVERCLRKSFPNGIFRPYPYCGHTMAIYLLDVGILKSTTLGFRDGVPFPEFDRKLRKNSAEYARNMARVNYQAGRKRWARALLDRAVELGTHPQRTQILVDKLFPEAPEPPAPAVAAIPEKPSRSVAFRVKRWFFRRIFGKPKKVRKPRKSRTALTPAQTPSEAAP